MVSDSDVYTPNGRTTAHVIWDLTVKPMDDQHCEFTNSVVALMTPHFLSSIEKQGITFEQAAAAGQAAISDHNRRETPLFAKSIERNALATHVDHIATSFSSVRLAEARSAIRRLLGAI